jgi:biotin operon repressor
MASAASTSIRRVKPAELARELGVSRQAVHDLIERGILQKGEDGTIDVDMAKVAIANRVRPGGKTAAAVLGPAPPPVGLPAPVPPPAEHQVDPAAATSFHVARTLRESEEARMAKIKRLQLEGSLIEREPAVTAVFTAFRTLRDSAMPLGRRVAPRVAAMTDTREIQLLIDEEVRNVLRTFADRTLASLTTTLTGEASAMLADLTGDAPEKAAP